MTESYRSTAYSRYRQFTSPNFVRLAASYSRRLDGRLRLQSNSKCLDVACGCGNFLAYLAAKGITDFLGVDSSEAAVAIARNQFGPERVIHADLFEYLSSTDGVFDLVSALDFIEHISKPELFDFLQLVSQRLRPTGKLLLRTPNASGLFGMAARYNDITHELCFTPNALADVLARANLRAVAIWEDTGTPVSLKQTAHWLCWQGARLFVRCLDAAETGSWGDGVLTRNMWALAERA